MVSASSAALAARRKSSAFLAQRIAALCEEFKATDVTILSLKGVSDMTDFFVIASGSSDTHVRSTAQRVEEELKREGNRVTHSEGLEQGRWVILDYVDVVVHVFHPAMRAYYQLERLWGDAAIVPLKQQGASA
ncbi:MAG: ribosome silencing factor [Gemmatimonadota bacterium]